MKIKINKGLVGEIEIEPSDIPLMQSCPSCVLGKSKLGHACATCGGRGVWPSELGWHIMSFVVENAAWYRDFKTGLKEEKDRKEAELRKK